MYRKMDEPQIGEGPFQTLHRGISSVRGTIVHHPEDPIRRGVGLLSHHLIYQPTEGLDPIFRFAAAKELGAMDIPGGQIGQRAPLRSYSCSTRVFRPSSAGRVGLGRRRAWMEVFSSAEITYSSSPSVTPSHLPS
jgi:hypothetical protein